MRKKLFFFIVLYGLISFNSIRAQFVGHKKYPEEIHKGRLATAIISESVFYFGGMSYLQFIWYQAPIEVFDGLYEGWGFSWGDMIANSAGASLLIGQELLFGDQVFKYKLSLS